MKSQACIKKSPKVFLKRLLQIQKEAAERNELMNNNRPMKNCIKKNDLLIETDKIKKAETTIEYEDAEKLNKYILRKFIYM